MVLYGMYFRGKSQIKMDLHNSIKEMKIIKKILCPCFTGVIVLFSFPLLYKKQQVRFKTNLLTFIQAEDNLLDCLQIERAVG